MSVELVKPSAEPGMEAVYRQEFSVHYDYPVHFTEHLFARDNPVPTSTCSSSPTATRRLKRSAT